MKIWQKSSQNSQRPTKMIQWDVSFNWRNKTMMDNMFWIRWRKKSTKMCRRLRRDSEISKESVSNCRQSGKWKINPTEKHSNKKTKEKSIGCDSGQAERKKSSQSLPLDCKVEDNTPMLSYLPSKSCSTTAPTKKLNNTQRYVSSSSQSL